jgi:DNA-binding beta-propeller fold protein YncE/mono/diheme cytochrome c family protein
MDSWTIGHESSEVAMRRLAPVLLLAAFPIGGCSLYFDEKDSSDPGLPVSGGTLLVTRDGTRAIAADPGRDRILVVDLAARKLATEIALQPGDEPGRVLEDGNGRIHVALRRGGAVVTLDQFNTAVAERRPVCAAPRGIAYQPEGDQLHVACATGELVTLPASTGAVTRTLDLDRDLRDINVVGNQLVISRFRSAQIIRLDAATGAEIGRGAPPSPLRDSFDDFGAFEQLPVQSSVAYRTIVAPNGSLIMVHQRAFRGELGTDPGGYGGDQPCQPGPVEATATVFDPAATTAVVSRSLPGTQLPVDIALAPTGDRVAVVNAGHRSIRLVWLSSLPSATMDPCNDFNSPDTEHTGQERYGMPSSVAFTPGNEIVVQHDFAIVLRDTFGDELAAIRIGDAETENLGRRRFHQPTASGLACASCHPEGREDGLAWEFDTLGLRRTQDIGGGLEDRAPFHWSGDMHSLDMLLDEVLVGRMGGEELSDDEREALPQFLFSLKAPPARTGLDQDAVARGRVVFENAACATCHNGPNFTNNAIVDVGTGGAFKVPSLVGVAWRAPFIHTGCAPTLRDRFGSCGGGDDHGLTSRLTQPELDDLLVYLESL